MSTVTCEVRLMLSAIETLDAAEMPAAIDEQGRTLQYGGYNGTQRLTATSTPKIEKPPAAATITLGGGITTLNLTAMALARDPSESHDFTGKKLVAAIFKMRATNNAAGVTIAPGASNPYPIYGTGNPVVLGPGRMEAFSFLSLGSNLPAVSGTVKNIDLSGTAGDILDVFLLFGE